MSIKYNLSHLSTKNSKTIAIDIEFININTYCLAIKNHQTL